jgi:hypothetical protein
LVGKLQRKTPLRKGWRKWKDVIKTSLGETECEETGCIHVAFVNMKM